MSSEAARARSLELHAAVSSGDERSYWQPMPANGYVTVKLTPEDTGSGSVAMGVQSVAPGGFVREHSHSAQNEIIHVLAGRGTALIEGERHDMRPGTVLFLPRNVRHSFVTEGEADLLFAWTIMPGGGLHEFFAAIGRPRQIGEPAPTPFERPGDVAAIEARTGFAFIKSPPTE